MFFLSYCIFFETFNLFVVFAVFLLCSLPCCFGCVTGVFSCLVRFFRRPNLTNVLLCWLIFFAVLLILFLMSYGACLLCCFFSVVVLRDYACPNMPPVTSLVPAHPLFPAPCTILPLWVPSNPCATICALLWRAHVLVTMVVFFCIFVCWLPVLFVCVCVCLDLLVCMCLCFVFAYVSKVTLCA